MQMHLIEHPDRGALLQVSVLLLLGDFYGVDCAKDANRKPRERQKSFRLSF